MPPRGPGIPTSNTLSFDTERFRVDVPRPDDVDSIYELVGGPDRDEVCATLIWDGPDRSGDIARWIERCRTESFEDFGFHWVVRDREGVFGGVAGAAIGAVGTRPLGPEGRSDVGYWVGRPYWGKGVMTEVLPALLDLGFGNLGFVKMEAEVFTGNTRGRRLVEKVGMTLEGVTRRAHLKRGSWVDIAHYGMLSEEWAGSKQPTV